ncbi:hypothetical protein ACFX19_026068 [Malus domestica]
MFAPDSGGGIWELLMLIKSNLCPWKDKEEIISLQMELESIKSKTTKAHDFSETTNFEQNDEPSLGSSLHLTSENLSPENGLETIQILADALPKIVPYVLINHREELLPLIMCAMNAIQIAALGIP